MSIMQRQKQKNSKLGYATDFVELVENSAHLISRNKIKIIANAGGVNPNECRKAIMKICSKKNINLKIAMVIGDDIYSDIDTLIENGQKFKNLDSDENVSSIVKNIYSANVYIDSFSIAHALELGADIVLCGRISDPGLVVAPCIYEFGWGKKEYDKLASATVAGHIIECGAQCTGGNFSKWMDIKNLDNIGYPIASVREDGYFEISKPENTGGIINKYTISEQILYELGNPRFYISPDVCVDFTSFNLKKIKKNVIAVEGVKGKAPTATFKVSISYFSGYKASGQLTISGPNAIEKAKKSADIIWNNLRRSGIQFDKTCTELLGFSSCHRSLAIKPTIVNEIILRIGVKSYNRMYVERFTKELAPLITSGPPGITGFSEGRPKVKEVIAYWPTLIDKNLIKTKAVI